ncbi:hypothetical protein JCM8547_006257 [Rhodosporidiobolus lusitaniae]
MLPTLPIDIHLLVLEQFATTTLDTLSRPDFYNDLLAVSIVCKTWSTTSQRLLRQHVYFSSEDQARRFLAVEEEKAEYEEGRTVTLVLHDELEREWHPNVVLAVLKRCRGAKEFVSNCPFVELFPLAPTFLVQFFPDLCRLALAWPYRSIAGRAIPSTVISISFLSTASPMARRFLVDNVATDASPDRSHFSSLTSLRLSDSSYTRQLLPLAHSLLSLHLHDTNPTQFDYSEHGDDAFVCNTFLRQCSALESLVADGFSPVLAQGLRRVAPTLKRLKVRASPIKLRDFGGRSFLEYGKRLKNLEWVRLPKPEEEKVVEQVQRECEERCIALVWA